MFSSSVSPQQEDTNRYDSSNFTINSSNITHSGPKTKLPCDRVILEWVCERRHVCDRAALESFCRNPRRFLSRLKVCLQKWELKAGRIQEASGGRSLTERWLISFTCIVLVTHTHVHAHAHTHWAWSDDKEYVLNMLETLNEMKKPACNCTELHHVAAIFKDSYHEIYNAPLNSIQ